MGQDDLARLIEKTEMESNNGLKDIAQIDYYSQVSPAIGTPKQHLATSSPATVVVLSKENLPGLKDHWFDVQTINLNYNAATAGVLCQLVVPKGIIAVLKGFGWSCPPAGFATVAFALQKNGNVFPYIGAAVPNVYLPSVNTINKGDLADCYESCVGPGTIEIFATNAAAAAILLTGRLVGYSWLVGGDEQEYGERKYANPLSEGI